MDKVVVKYADATVSPLGLGSMENYEAVKAGRSALCRHEGLLPEAFVASLIDRQWLAEACREAGIRAEQYTVFEQMILLAGVKAVASAGIDASSPRVLFVVSTTKGNVSLLDGHRDFPAERVGLGAAARCLNDFFGNPNPPVVVCNACISGVCAQLTAWRNLLAGHYDAVVCVGADEQSPFIISGFQSLKALSDEPCRPFDETRKGLNLGECAAAVVYGLKEKTDLKPGDWMLLSGAIRSDANHISGPSRTGEGSFEALRQTLKGYDTRKLAFINVHGTATMYNDEMESIAIDRAGLIDLPVSGLKGCYGHTMGAAGLLECILSMKAVEDGQVLATRGFRTLGVSRTVKVSSELRPTDRNAFVKLISGFGGCNAAILMERYTE